MVKLKEETMCRVECLISGLRENWDDRNYVELKELLGITKVAYKVAIRASLYNKGFSAKELVSLSDETLWKVIKSYNSSKKASVTTLFVTIFKRDIERYIARVNVSLYKVGAIVKSHNNGTELKYKRSAVADEYPLESYTDSRSNKVSDETILKLRNALKKVKEKYGVYRAEYKILNYICDKISYNYDSITEFMEYIESSPYDRTTKKTYDFIPEAISELCKKTNISVVTYYARMNKIIAFLKK